MTTAARHPSAFLPEGRRPPTGYLYFIRLGPSPGYVRIGFASNPWYLLPILRAASPDVERLVAAVPGTPEDHEYLAFEVGLYRTETGDGFYHLEAPEVAALVAFVAEHYPPPPPDPVTAFILEKGSAYPEEITPVDQLAAAFRQWTRDTGRVVDLTAAQVVERLDGFPHFRHDRTAQVVEGLRLYP